jgi:uridine phosphorylase
MKKGTSFPAWVMPATGYLEQAKCIHQLNLSHLTLKIIMLANSELILTPDKRIYHLHIKPEQIAENIILVGDPGRVEMIGEFFENIEFLERNREFVTLTGLYKGERITAMSTGIGVGNIDIVLNELDALVNIDFDTREIRKDKRVLNLVRIGTSGALQDNISIGSYILSKQVIGLDGLLNFQSDKKKVCEVSLEEAFVESFAGIDNIAHPYAVSGSEILFSQFKSEKTFSGITLTAPGFYGSQGRVLRMELAIPGFNDSLEKFEFNGQRITNYEMETSALFGYSKLLGHEAMTICLALANRPRKEALKDYQKEMKGLIEYTLDKLV